MEAFASGLLFTLGVIVVICLAVFVTGIFVYKLLMKLGDIIIAAIERGKNK